MKNILVTGVTGFIGSHTCVELLDNDYIVIGLDNLYNSEVNVIDKISKITNKNLKFYECDLLNQKCVEKIFQENKIDAVIHFAALKAVGESVSFPLKYYTNNLSGTLNLLNVMEKFNCKKFIFSSSATVYGKNNPIPYLEHFEKSSTSPYGYSKVMIEQILSDICKSDKEFSSVMLRYFNPIGAHKSGLIGENPKGIPNNLMPYICDVAIGKRGYLNIFGNDYNTIDGTGVRDYIHVNDVAIGHVKSLEYVLRNTGEMALNLGTGKGTSVLQLVKIFEKVSGKKIEIRFCNRREGDIDEFYADVKKSREILNWSAKYSIEEMCRDSWNFITSNNKKI